ncbi:hypothetical protein F5Y12DRAFT_113388 [Xylaria sp. FL1777]|nr:hypothetical protein F5Y12DRAFT_113388 [Xylaria sp. FL1777]
MTSKADHLDRTAAEPRDKLLHTVILEHREEVNNTTRIFHLGIPRDSPPIRFLPGQWLDVYVPGVEKAGGFTITSTPREARLAHPSTEPEDAGETSPRDKPAGENGKATRGKGGPYLELAVQRSPENPPAAWLWQEADSSTVDGGISSPTHSSTNPSSIIGRELRVRVGGGFVWPPPGVNVRALRRAVFVAGGVGVNPLVSMLCSLASAAAPASRPSAAGGDLEVRFLYSVKDPALPGVGGPNGGKKYRNAKNVLFLERIARVFRQGLVKGRLELFLTGRDAGTADVEGGRGGEEGGTRTSKDGNGDGDAENEIIVCGGDAGNGDRGDGGKDDFTIPFHPRRCTVADDVATAVGNPRFAVVYVCGVPTMTDEFVTKLTSRGAEGGLGMEPHRVLCEKWW